MCCTHSRWVRGVSASSLKPLTRLWMQGPAVPKWNGNLSLTCEFLGAILWRAEPETLRFTYVSPRAQALLGYWLERWTGETNFWKKHLFPDDRELVAAACRTGSARAQKRGFRVPHGRRPRPGPLVSCRCRPHRTPWPKAGTGRCDERHYQPQARRGTRSRPLFPPHALAG